MQKFFFLITRWVNIRHRNRTLRPTGHWERTHLLINFRSYVTTLLHMCPQTIEIADSLVRFVMPTWRVLFRDPVDKMFETITQISLLTTSVAFFTPSQNVSQQISKLLYAVYENAATRTSKPYLIPSIFAVQKNTTRWLAQLCSIWIEPS